MGQILDGSYQLILFNEVKMAEIRFSTTNLFLSVNVTEFDKGKNWKIVDIVTNFSGNIYWIAKHQ